MLHSTYNLNTPVFECSHASAIFVKPDNHYTGSIIYYPLYIYKLFIIKHLPSSVVSHIFGDIMDAREYVNYNVIANNICQIYVLVLSLVKLYPVYAYILFRQHLGFCEEMHYSLQVLVYRARAVLYKLVVYVYKYEQVVQVPQPIVNCRQVRSKQVENYRGSYLLCYKVKVIQ